MCLFHNNGIKLTGLKTGITGNAFVLYNEVWLSWGPDDGIYRTLFKARGTTGACIHIDKIGL